MCPISSYTLLLLFTHAIYGILMKTRKTVMKVDTRFFVDNSHAEDNHKSRTRKNQMDSVCDW